MPIQKLGTANNRMEKERAKIADRILADGGIDPDWERDQKTDRQRHDAEFEGDRNALQYELENGSRLPERTAEITPQNAGDPGQVLFEHWPVETERVNQLIAVELVSRHVILAQHHVDHVARNHPHRGEHDQTCKQERRDQRQQAARDIAVQGLTRGRRRYRVPPGIETSDHRLHFFLPMRNIFCQLALNFGAATQYCRRFMHTLRIVTPVRCLAMSL